jgi:hypothetical protein
MKKKFKLIKDRIKKFNKKRVIVIASIIVVAITVSVILGKTFASPNDKERISESLTNIASSFYKNFYYPLVTKDETKEKNDDYFEKYSAIGFKVSLDVLERHNNGEFKEEIATYINSETKESCDKEKPAVTIYPKSPYGKDDFNVEITVECGFEDSKK